MRNLFANPSLNIAAGHAVSGVAERERTVRVDCGKVWITVEGSSADYWLASGESIKVAPGRLVVIEADHVDSRVSIPSPATRAPAFDLSAATSRLLGLQWMRNTKMRSN